MDCNAFLVDARARAHDLKVLHEIKRSPHPSIVGSIHFDAHFIFIDAKYAEAKDDR